MRGRETIKECEYGYQNEHISSLSVRVNEEGGRMRIFQFD